MLNNKNTKKAFTLIELLMVVSVIGILSSIVLTSISGATKKARDAERKSDLSQIQKALEIYQISHDGRYPSISGIYETSKGICNSVPCSGNNWDQTSNLITNLRDEEGIEIMIDPLNTSNYYYLYKVDCTGGICDSYQLQAKLEDGVTITRSGSSD